MMYNVGQPKSKAIRVRMLKQHLLKERGPKCERCPYDRVPVLQVHHVIRRADGGTDALSNLLLVCGNCHEEIHHGIRDAAGNLL